MSEDIKKKKNLGRGLEALLGEMNEDVLSRCYTRHNLLRRSGPSNRTERAP